MAISVKAPYTCKYCGCPSYLEPGEQEMPADYCHESDHGSPDDIEENDEE